MKTSKLLARAVLPAGAAILSLSAWAVASSNMPVVDEPTRQVVEPTVEVTSPMAVVTPPVAVVEEPVLAPQVGNMKYGCRLDLTVEAVAPGPTVEAATPQAGRTQ